MSKNGGCKPNCGHTEAEHAAFDRGVKDGRIKGFEAECPAEYRDDDNLLRHGKSGGA